MSAIVVLLPVAPSFFPPLAPPSKPANASPPVAGFPPVEELDESGFPRLAEVVAMAGREEDAEEEACCGVADIDTDV